MTLPANFPAAAGQNPLLIWINFSKIDMIVLKSKYIKWKEEMNNFDKKNQEIGMNDKKKKLEWVIKNGALK